MDLKLRVQRMLQIVEGAECNGALADIERDILLNELREAYTELKFGEVEVAHVEPKVETPAEVVVPVVPAEEDEESEENEVEVELIFDDGEDDEPIIEDEPVVAEPEVAEPEGAEPEVAAPIVEEPIAEEVVEPTIEEEPAIEEPAIEEPIEEPVIEPTVEEEPEADEVVVYEAPAEEETEEETDDVFPYHGNKYILAAEGAARRAFGNDEELPDPDVMTPALADIYRKALELTTQIRLLSDVKLYHRLGISYARAIRIVDRFRALGIIERYASSMDGYLPIIPYSLAVRRLEEWLTQQMQS